MITFEKETDVHWKVLRYGSPIGAIGVNRRSLRVYVNSNDMIVPKTAKPVLKQLLDTLACNSKELELYEYANNNDFISIKAMKQILSK